MDNETLKQNVEQIESDEFDDLLNAARLVEKSGRNLYSLDKTVSTLKYLIYEGQTAVECGRDLSIILNDMETLIDEISDNIYHGI